MSINQLNIPAIKELANALKANPSLLFSSEVILIQLKSHI